MQKSQTSTAWDALLQPTGPGHARLAAALRAAIRDGRLPAGGAVPSSRLLAADLGCSRWVVTEAYQQLVAEGYLVTRAGSATRVAGSGHPDRVRATPVAPGSAPPVDLAPGLPDLRAFPLRAWLRAGRTVAATLPYQRLGYPTPGGEPELREVLAAYLNRVRGAAASPDRVTVCAGAVDAVRRICATVRADRVGSGVAVEDPGWTRFRAVVAAAGLRVVPVPVDDDGIRVDDLARRPDVRVVIVSPAHQFPTGVVLAPARRAALLDWARRVDGLIVEDDYDAEFRYDRRPVGTMQGTDPDRVALTGSVSKTMSPAMGLGWLVGPGRWTRAVEGPGPPVLDQLALATFLSSGGYDRHLRAGRRRYRERRDALVDALAAALPGAVVSGAAAGLHLLVRPPGPAGPALVDRAAALGLRIVCVERYRVDHRAFDGTLVLGYGNLADREVTLAVDRLAAALRGPERLTG